MSFPRRLRSPLAGAALLVVCATGGPVRAADAAGPPLDREPHETVQTATFALG